MKNISYTDEELQEMREQAYIEGQRSIAQAQLGDALQRLSYLDDKKYTLETMLYEREGAIAMLRIVCNDFGDKEWDEKLHLADIIDKHLARHLHNDDKMPYAAISPEEKILLVKRLVASELKKQPNILHPTMVDFIQQTGFDIIAEYDKQLLLAKEKFILNCEHFFTTGYDDCENVCENCFQTRDEIEKLRAKHGASKKD